ncbi:MAG: IclR family transcriptional regulator [Rectinema sp.]|jgi:DNA-binding IclR family transcriptional regulator
MIDKSQESSSRPSGFIQSVDRAITILEFFSHDRPESRVSDIARDLNLNKSTTFGLLCTLERRGYVEQNPETGKYRLGLRILDLANVKLASFDVAQVAHPILSRLVDSLGETVHLAVYDHGEVIYIDKVEADNALRISSFIGKRNPAYCTGVGKCLLAFQPEAEIERVIADGLVARTSNTIIDKTQFRAELLAIREQERARDNEEFSFGLVCVASPIHDHKGRVCAALSVSAPTIRSSSDRISLFEQTVSRAARDISEALGYKSV